MSEKQATTRTTKTTKTTKTASRTAAPRTIKSTTKPPAKTTSTTQRRTSAASKQAEPKRAPARPRQQTLRAVDEEYGVRPRADAPVRLASRPTPAMRKVTRSERIAVPVVLAAGGLALLVVLILALVGPTGA